MAIKYLDVEDERPVASGKINYLDEQDINIAEAGPLAARAAQGMSYGLSDIVSPYTGAAIAKAYDFVTGSGLTDDMSFDDLVNQGRQGLEQKRDKIREQNPVAAYGAEVVGSLPTSGAIFGAAAKASTALNMGRAAKPTALAVAGATEAGAFSEAKTLDGYMKDIATGAVLAPVTVAGFDKVAPLASKAVSKFSKVAVAPARELLEPIFRANTVAARKFMEEGVPVSALAISDNPVVTRLGSILSGTFGSTNQIQKSTTKTINAIEKRLAQIGTPDPITLQRAGEAAQKGISGHIEKFKAVSGRLFDGIGKEMAGKRTPLAASRRFVASQLSEFADASNLVEKVSSNKAVADVVSAIEDAGSKGLSYNALKRYRTEIGSTITENAISGIDNGMAKSAYAALTQDMREMASSAGAKTLRKFDRANAFYANGVEQIEQRLSRYIGTRADPAAIINTIKSSSKNSDFKVGAIIKAIPPRDRSIITDAVLQRIGRDRAGTFSPTRFFKDYAQISPEAKRVLFGRDGAAMRKSLNNLADISKRLSETARFENFSRSADNISNIGLLALTAADFGSGASVGVSSNLSARLLTNEKFATTLADFAGRPVTKTAVDSFLKKMGKLAVDNPQMASDITAYIGLFGATAATITGDKE